MQESKQQIKQVQIRKVKRCRIYLMQFCLNSDGDSDGDSSMIPILTSKSDCN